MTHKWFPVNENPIKVIVAMLMNYSSMVTGSHIYALHMAIADLMLICTLPFQIIEISRSGIDRRQAIIKKL